MTLPMTLPQELTRPTMFGLPLGDIQLITASGVAFPLPDMTAPNDEVSESNDALMQAPGAWAGLRTGWQNSKPLSLTYSTDGASSSGLLVFPTDQDALRWSRAFAAACRASVSLLDGTTNEIMDGWVKQFTVKHHRLGHLRRFSLEFQGLYPSMLSSAWTTVNGSPAVCPNVSTEPAFPRITLTATGGTVTVSDGVRTLTLTTTPGHQLVIDSSISDGRVLDGGALGFATGLFPRIAPGGTSITVTGASGLQVSYRQPTSPEVVIVYPPGGGGSGWTLGEAPGQHGGVVLSGGGLSEAPGNSGGVVLSGDGLTQTSGPNGGAILTR